ncbi:MULTISPECIES: Hsp20/alpha crystallin family protein [unclassified Bacillus (in: firmicutes)]|uniref:Hsp20/alpha crystallin family protein n=1 Tax=unclassified Bacillus (in: firmicutes) TaxID=185979 RepID=UPI0008EEBBA3|nr:MULTISPECIES: Hsp20/alpha crystallin family protein [unclassified Bacillus (in: firmicutes)]SFA99015.1 Molecular chaperone IbpA, HSP20 family [Bacillus sp. UNCCL13]SFQ81401.1 Molecular chaperone IbpA, HSP20 family [Bacillus sp. cl95]
MSEKSKGNEPKETKRSDQPFGQLMKSMNDFFQEKPVRGLLQTMDEFFHNPNSLSLFQSDLEETENEHIIRAAFPGIRREQIKIDILGKELTISVKHEEAMREEDSKNSTFLSRQWRQHSSKTFTLPYPINENTTKATYKDGLLEIHIKKQKGKNILIQE